MNTNPESPKILNYDDIFGEDGYDIYISDIEEYYEVNELDLLLIDITDVETLPD